MSIRCTISGEVPNEPVVTRNGDIYEKNVILKVIKATGLCPVTKQPLSEEDLIPIKIDNPESVKPRLTSGTTISGVLQTLQTEWDALMLETFNLKKQLETARRELSHALYQHDASCRVIARLIKERDQAREELERWKAEVSNNNNRPEFQFRALTSEVKEVIKQKFEELSGNRKERETSENLSTVEDIQEYTNKNSFPIHKTTAPGILCLDIHPTKPELIVTGGLDKSCVVFNTSTGKKVATLNGHEKQVNTTAFHPDDIVFSGSDDTTVKVWSPTDNGYECTKTFSEHKAPVVDVCLHPSNVYLLTTSRDSSWGFYDFEKGTLLTQVMDIDRYPFTCCHIHPDGYIFSVGTQNNVIRIFDLRNQKNVASFQGHTGAINDVHFSENGVYLASCSEDNSIKEWDLRGPVNITTLKLDETPLSIQYDYSGTYLGVTVGRELRLFHESKQNNEREMKHVKTFDDHTDIVTDLRFGPDAKYILSSSLDKNVIFWEK